MSNAPLAIDLYAGLGGWSEGLIAEGYAPIGFDIERHVYGEHRYPAQLVIQDVLTLHGSQFRDAALIVASPPCQEFSYMAMPWSRAKAQASAIRSDTTGAALADLTRLFDACFRIQREACEAAGRHIPLVVENVRGAQPWVGRARWNFGSFYFWGDVPALMPVAGGRKAMKAGIAHRSNGATNFHGVKSGGFKSAGMDCGDPEKRGRQAIDGTKHHGDWFRDPTCPTRQGGQKGKKYDDAVKRPGVNLSEIGFNVANAIEFAHMVDGVKITRTAEDKRQHVGTTRKFASAMIAKIPLALSRHVAAVYRP